MSSQIKRLYEFGPFRLDAAKRSLLRGGDLVPLAPKVLEILQVLVENSGEIVDKDELMQRLWPDTFVEEGNLSVNIFALRKALNDSGDKHQYIRTIPRRGYCFVAGVKEVREGGVPALAEPLAPEPVAAQAPATPPATQVDRPGPETPAATVGAEASEAVVETKQSPRPRRLALVLLALLAVPLTAFVASRPAGLSLPGAGAASRTLAVLPFETIGAAAGDDHLGPGVADALVTTLAHLRGLTVRPLCASLKYGGAVQDATEVGRALHADAVLEGSLRRAGRGFRVTARLVRVKDGSRLWETRSSEEFESLFAARHAISEGVARALAVKLTDHERGRMAKRPTGSAEAYELYLKGRHLGSRRTSRGVEQAIACFERAVNIDPGFALAYAEAAAFRVLPVNPQPGVEKMRRAKEAALKALALDEGLAEAHAALARAVTFCDWDWAGAEKEFQRAIELNPNYSEAHFWYASNLSALGRHGEAVAEMKLAHEGDPFSTRNNLGLAWTYYLARRYDEAIARLRQTPLELDSAYYQIYWRLGLAYAQQAKHEEAAVTLQKAAVLSGDRPLAKASLGYVFAKAGRRSEAQQILSELGGQAGPDGAPFITLSAIHACLGDNDRAFEWLEGAYARREGRLIDLRVEPMLDGLRADPRYEALARRMGLAH